MEEKKDRTEFNLQTRGQAEDNLITYNFPFHFIFRWLSKCPTCCWTYIQQMFVLIKDLLPNSFPTIIFAPFLKKVINTLLLMLYPKNCFMGCCRH